MLHRYGIRIERANFCNWAGRSAARLGRIVARWRAAPFNTIREAAPNTPRCVLAFTGTAAPYAPSLIASSRSRAPCSTTRRRSIPRWPLKPHELAKSI